MTAGYSAVLRALVQMSVSPSTWEPLEQKGWEEKKWSEDGQGRRHAFYRCLGKCGFDGSTHVPARQEKSKTSKTGRGNRNQS